MHVVTVSRGVIIVNLGSSVHIDVLCSILVSTTWQVSRDIQTPYILYIYIKAYTVYVLLTNMKETSY